jgi:hypothetical protein
MKIPTKNTLKIAEENWLSKKIRIKNIKIFIELKMKNVSHVFLFTQSLLLTDLGSFENP